MSANGEKDEHPATIRLDAGLYAEVAQVAKRERRSVSAQILYYVEQGLHGRQQMEAA